jgi:hypothetical protein
MPRQTRRPYSRSSSSRSSETGRDFALRHIEQARRLTAELGGTDQDVKRYFFDLRGKELTALLDEYETHHGTAAREYAEETLPKWKSGQVQMGGQTAERLFKLLPPRMPLADKYRLTKNLWEHVGPSSKQTIRVGLDADLDAAMEVVEARIQRVVTSYQIPASMEQRFNWLTAGDVQLRQELLNRLLREEEDVLIEGVRLQFPVMMGHLRSEDGRYTQHMSQTVTIGEHHFKVLLDPAATGVRVEEGIQTPLRVQSGRDGSTNLGWLWWAIPAAIVILVALSERG